MVALNRCKDKEFWDGVTFRLRHKGVMTWNPEPHKEVLDSYFEEPKDF